ncbi:MAG: hypothetical protein KKB62_02080 [Nanoarchaeota archaeon]|nr:hypothetical protein [Nanoarchaeota archaeon]
MKGSSRINFLFDPKKDWENFFYVIKNDKWGIPPEFKGLSENEIKKNIQFIHSQNFFRDYPKIIRENWEPFEKRFFKIIEKIFNKPIAHRKYKAYLTTMTRCPYFYKKNDPWFMISFYNSIPSIFMTIAHEIFHMQFHAYLGEKVRNMIGELKMDYLSEAITVIINEEFRDLFLSVQRDPSREKIRGFILNEWKKNKNLEEVVQKSIKYIKNKVKFHGEH